jgi:hypothetical protein
MKTSIKDIDNYFDRMGWRSLKQEGATSLYIFSGTNRDFILGVGAAEEWVIFSIPNYLPVVSPEKIGIVSETLVKKNAEMRLVKFAIGEGGEVLLSTDIPAMVKLEYDLFCVYVDALCYYANTLHSECYELITGTPYVAKEQASNG